MSAELGEATPTTAALRLSPVERDTLTACELTIRTGLKIFYEVGEALLTIRDARLYRADFATFEDYCRERWRIDRTYAHRLIDAAGVVNNLLPIGNKIPATESQTRELAPLDPEQRATANAARISGTATTKSRAKKGRKQ